MDKLGSFLQSIKPIQDGDLVDRVSYFYSVLVVTISSFVVFSWSFFGSPLECWFPPQFKKWWDEYGRDYCFAQNTYFVPFTKDGPAQVFFDYVSRGVEIPHDPAERQEQNIPYYQWVPFVLALVALCFYAPVVLWRTLSNASGLRVKAICEMACSVENIRSDERHKRISTISRFVESTVNVKRHMHRETILTGRYVMILFLFIKLVYLANAVLQFYIMKKFLGLKSNLWGAEMLSDLMKGRGWGETGNFPRVTFCDFDIRENAQVHHYTVQCVLLINMLNEKIFLFLWWWMVLVMVVTAVSFLYWVLSSVLSFTGNHMVTAYLNLYEKDLEKVPAMQEAVKNFIKVYLRSDGIFLIRLISHNAGDTVAAELTQALWEGYKLHNPPVKFSPTAPSVTLAKGYTGYATLPRYEDAVARPKESKL